MDVEEREVADLRGQVGVELPVGRLESGGHGAPEALAGLIDLADETVMVRDPLLDDLVAHTHRVHPVDGCVEVALLGGQQFLVLPPQFRHDVILGLFPPG